MAHGGRKAACYPPYHKYEENNGKLSRGTAVPDSEGGFANDICAPTAVAWSSDMPVPKELTIPEIKELVQKFADAAKRSVEAGVDVIEVTRFLFKFVLFNLRRNRNHRFMVLMAI